MLSTERHEEEKARLSKSQRKWCPVLGPSQMHDYVVLLTLMMWPSKLQSIYF